MKIAQILKTFNNGIFTLFPLLDKQAKTFRR